MKAIGDFGGNGNFSSKTLRLVYYLHFFCINIRLVAIVTINVYQIMFIAAIDLISNSHYNFKILISVFIS